MSRERRDFQWHFSSFYFRLSFNWKDGKWKQFSWWDIIALQTSRVGDNDESSEKLLRHVFHPLWVIFASLPLNSHKIHSKLHRKLKSLFRKFCRSIKSMKISLPLINRVKKIRSNAKWKRQLFNAYSKVDNKVAYRGLRGVKKFYVARGWRTWMEWKCFLIYHTKQRAFRLTFFQSIL